MRITVNGEVRAVATGLTIVELLDELDLVSERVAVEVNRELVPRTRHAERELREGDTIEVVTLVGGG